MKPKIERLTENLNLGDSPHWNPDNQNLYFVDILGKTIHRYNTSTKRHTQASVGARQVSFIIPIKSENGQFVISLSKELHRIKWDGESSNIELLEKLGEVETEKETFFNRFNHGKCDPSGRLWAGTMCTLAQRPLVFPPIGKLYTINAKKQFESHLDEIRIPTGLAFDRNSNKMYYIDSLSGTIDQYDFDEENGKIYNYTAVFTLEKHNINGIANGMTIDSDGNLWVAIFNGSKIIKIDPRTPECLLQTIDMPVKQITSITFGGSKYEDLYVTTGAYKFDGQEDFPPPDNGALYKVSGLGVTGLPPNEMDLLI